MFCWSCKTQVSNFNFMIFLRSWEITPFESIFLSFLEFNLTSLSYFPNNLLNKLPSLINLFTSNLSKDN